jgi:hypothetical protein
LKDDEHTDRPRTAKSELKIEDRSRTVDEVATAEAAAGVSSHGTCHKIMSDDLNMFRVAQHSVPRFLTGAQREDRMITCGDLIDSADKYGTFLNRIITGDETLCFLYDLQLKRQSATWK